MAIKTAVYTLDELCTVITDGSHTSPKSLPNGKSMLSVKDMTDFGFDFVNSKKISDKDFEMLVKAGCRPKYNDVLVAKDGSVMKHIFSVDKDIDAVLLSSIAILRPDLKLISSKYLVYLLINNRDRILNTFKSGSGVPRIVLRDFKKIKFEIPDLQIQNKVISILHRFDSAEISNLKIINTIEDIIQSVFNSWFIDFDVVHEKQKENTDGKSKKVGIDSEILNLFPNEFIESELGIIPEGWKVSQLEECDLTIESGRRPRGGIDKELKSGIPSVGAESIASTGVFDFSKVKYVAHEFALNAKKGWVQNMDVALYKDGGKPGLFMPRVGLYGRSFPFKNFMINEHVFLLRSKKLGQCFLYGLITSDNVLNQLISKASAKAAQPGLNQKEVKSIKFVLPSMELIENFNRLVRPMIEKQLESGRQIQSLRKTRDLLLPKLLSGQLDVSGLELDNVTH